MPHSEKEILEILDKCAESLTFPMLDNGYFYPANSKLTVFKDDDSWAIVIEIFGFSPRSGDPDISIYTFSNDIQNRSSSSSYLLDNPHNELSMIFPINNQDWMDFENCEVLASEGVCELRNTHVPLPHKDEYAKCGIELSEDEPQTFEFCRYLALKFKEDTLCQKSEREKHIPKNMRTLLELENWYHPDLVDDELPSHCESFKQIAHVIVTGDASTYKPTKPPNNHWSNWPEAGLL